jgi:hypothetical protein
MDAKDNTRHHPGRIPATLQAVFLASNRGKEVDKPPKTASKVFFRNWLFQRQTGSKDKRGSLFGGSDKSRNEKMSASPPKKDATQVKPVVKVAEPPRLKVCEM